MQRGGGLLPVGGLDGSERERCRLAAHLYYDGDFTQEDVAAYLGISRPWVSRLLKRARELGVVRVTVEPPLARAGALEKTLARALGIARCLISTTLDLDGTAALAADALVRSLRDDDVVGIGWGNTIARTVAACQTVDAPPERLRCVALIGGANSPRPEIDSGHLVPLLACKIGAVATVLSAPAFVESARMRDVLARERSIGATLALAERTTVALLCVGGLTDTTSRTIGTLSEREFAAVRQLGAVGDVSQWFIDATGERLARGPVQRMIGADLGRIRERARERIVVAIGEARVAALIAAARGGWYTTLVTNIATARSLFDALGVRATDLTDRIAVGK
ncbi:MAG: sugar-binding transcriptional regulator [Vulcanimicrobiaceae bacterium]